MSNKCVLKLGRFVVDGHIHCGEKDAAKKNSKSGIVGVMAEVEPFDNSAQALWDMDAYAHILFHFRKRGRIGTPLQTQKAFEGQACTEFVSRLKAMVRDRPHARKAARDFCSAGTKRRVVRPNGFSTRLFYIRVKR